MEKKDNCIAGMKHKELQHVLMCSPILLLPVFEVTAELLLASVALKP